MCGIAGKLNLNGQPVDKDLLHRMCDASIHRGPDDEGIFQIGPVGLGFRRLSIIDVAGGHQPMSNEDGSIWIVFNGEIYNYQELRREIASRGHQWSTNSDTEVVIHLYEDFGADCVEKLNGMFAFAIWDNSKKRLFLARDRMGQKPLHYIQINKSFIFGSEIQSILQDPAVPRQLNLDALDQYLSSFYVPSPQTMFKDIFKLPPAHYMICEQGNVHIERYWQLDFSKKEHLPEAAQEERIIDLLDDATHLRLMSEVPLGAFLSGGIDSSLVVALMKRHLDRPVKTFSIGFDIQDKKWLHELPYARKIAEYLETDHSEFIIRPDIIDVLPKLVWHYGEPFGDNSSVPTYYISKMTRTQVTVALSGDGGDELFGGYGLYTFYDKFNLAWLLRSVGVETLRDITTLLSNLKPEIVKTTMSNRKRVLVSLLRDGRDSVYQFARLRRCFRADQKRLLYRNGMISRLDSDAYDPLYQISKTTGSLEGLDRWFLYDILTYLPDDILVKVDIASMANSLEVRSPFMDHRVVELAASIPANLKVRDGATKYILKKASAGILPPEIINRPKWGFGLPLNEWLRTDLYQFACDTLLDKRSRERDLFNSDYIIKMLKQHASGQVDYGNHIWLLINFEIWCRTFLDNSPLPITL
ncbi:MAG: asparagine synthase (glutamine-hydrolyzing) [Anaerolineales bacterium]|nr:asparagine synthase (glutamine-hydrolyzing) [Anaerolineales bacterium]